MTLNYLSSTRMLLVMRPDYYSSARVCAGAEEEGEDGKKEKGDKTNRSGCIVCASTSAHTHPRGQDARKFV